MARRVNIRDDDDERVVDRDYDTDRNYQDDDDHGTNWLPLLIVPLLLGGLLWGLQSYSQNAVDRTNPNGQQFGVGGGPVVSQPVSPTSMPSATPTAVEGTRGVVPTIMISPTDTTNSTNGM